MRDTSKLKKWLLLSFGTLLIVFGGIFAYAMANRDAYLTKAVEKIKSKLKNEYNIDFLVSNYKFDGLATVVFDDITIVPESKDTLVSMEKFGVGVKIWPLLFNEVAFDNLELYKGKVSFVKRDTISNYDFLFKKNKADSLNTEKPNERNFAIWVEKLAKQVFAKVPENMQMRDFEVSYRDTFINQRIRIPELIIDNGDFETSLFLNDQDGEWVFKGNIDSDDQNLYVEVSSKQKDTEVPFLKGKYGLGVSFDKLIFHLSGIKRAAKELLLVNGSFQYENLVIKHKRLSDNNILLPHAEIKGGIEISTNSFALEEGTRFSVENFVVEPIFKIELKPEKKVSMGVHTGMFKVQDFFDALPKGLFETLEGIEVDGNAAFDLDFAVNLDNPENIMFQSSIDDVDVKVLKWGEARIDSLNYPFFYDASDGEKIIRKIFVGSSNPNFIPLNQIPYVVKTTIRNTEDPFFYKHNGFEEEAFKLSIQTNLKEKRFKRGASTISMQLIKNIYLNRKKTMNRKLEEILLVWLMETSGEVSKDRIFEIYLNVIEWGRNVYGIEEAARYYFDKSARDLSLGESLYLSSIIPRPKTGLSSFDHTGHLKSWLSRHFNTYGSIMSRGGELKSVEVPENYGFYEVVLKPSLRPKAPIMTDSLSNGMSDEDTLLLKELEVEEKTRKSILDRLLNKAN